MLLHDWRSVVDLGRVVNFVNAMHIAIYILGLSALSMPDRISYTHTHIHTYIQSHKGCVTASASLNLPGETTHHPRRPHRPHRQRRHPTNATWGGPLQEASIARGASPSRRTALLLEGGHLARAPHWDQFVGYFNFNVSGS